MIVLLVRRKGLLERHLIWCTTGGHQRLCTYLLVSTYEYPTPKLLCSRSPTATAGRHPPPPLPPMPSPPHFCVVTSETKKHSTTPSCVWGFTPRFIMDSQSKAKDCSIISSSPLPPLFSLRNTHKSVRQRSTLCVCSKQWHQKRLSWASTLVGCCIAAQAPMVGSSVVLVVSSG